MARVGTFTKAAYGFGQAAEGIKNASFALFVLFYYRQVLGVPGALAGLALFVATVFDAVTDPLAGSLSDRLRHRWGRRHPFMYASAVPLGVTFALLFTPPEGLDDTGQFLWLVTFAVLVRGAMTLYHVPHMALGAELSRDYTERTSIVAYRAFFSVMGYGLAIGAAWTVFFADRPGFPDGQLDAAAYPPFGLLFGALATLLILASALGTHDRIATLPAPPDDLGRLSAASFVGEYRAALSNRSFRSLFIGLLFFFVMRGVQDVLGVHMGTFFWELPPNSIGLVQAAALPGLLLGAPLWTVVARRIDKKPTFLIGITIVALTTLAPPVAKIAGFYPPMESPFYLGLLILAMAVGALGAMAGLVTAGSMIADITDEHELATGRRQEGIFFAALSFAVKSTSGLGAFVAGIALDAIAFPQDAVRGEVGAQVTDRLGILYGPGVGVLAVFSLLFLSRYRIDRTRHAETAAALAARERPR